MTIEELLRYLKSRQLNPKTNNIIIIGNYSNNLIDEIPNATSVSFLNNDIDIDFASNIKIDLSKTNVKDILTYTLNHLKKLNLIDTSLEYVLPFNDKLDINRFRIILQKNNRVVQLVFYNMENLSIEEQMLFNELYYYNSYSSPTFCVISLTNAGFKTYFLTHNRVLDNRENYQICNINNYVDDSSTLKHTKQFKQLIKKPKKDNKGNN